MCARTGSRILRASSGSRSESSSSERLRSANRTVTCFRSPSSADLAVRIRSARWLGVYASGEADGDIVAAPDGVTFFFQAEDGIRDVAVTGVQTCALPI